ncbi:MAG: class I SAM-dependent methyltransferase [Anaeromyxobacter sp.]
MAKARKRAAKDEPSRKRSGVGRAHEAVDLHRLYEASVQDAPSEVDIIQRFLRRAGRPARRLREDFSGTALVSAEWVRRGADRTATAVDLDPGVHAWAREHRLPELGAAARRLKLVTADVRRPNGRDFDAIVALNYSYWVFKTREAMRAYLAAARRALAPGGVLVLDVQGGWESQQEIVESRRVNKGVRYFWEHEKFDPITHHLRAAIHFEVPGRPRLRRVFHYDWRLWTLPELTELCEEAGLVDVGVYWDVAPVDDTRYVLRRHAENQPGWIAYLVAHRPRRD